MKKLLLFVSLFTSLFINAQENIIETTGNVGIGTLEPEAMLHVQDENVGVKTTYGASVFESDNMGLDLISKPTYAWGSAINFIEGNITENTDMWSIARQTTNGDGDSSLRFSFGSDPQSYVVNPPKVTFTADGKVGVGMVPSADADYVLGVNGKVDIVGGIPDGKVWGDDENTWEGSMLLKIGQVPNIDENVGLFNFQDFPASNKNTKSITQLWVEDRSFHRRLFLRAETSGSTEFVVYDSNQENLFKIYDTINAGYVTLEKPNTYFTIGGEHDSSLGHKLVVKDGSALIEGALTAATGEFTKSLPDGTIFEDGLDRLDQCSVLAAGMSFGVESSFNWYNFPASNIDPLSKVVVTVEDRNYKKRWGFDASTGGSLNLFYYNKEQSPIYKLSEDGNDNVSLYLPKENSSVAIATNIVDGYKLAVGGKGVMEELKIALQGTDAWPDYVFENDYQLPTLKEVEKHIKKKGHLENIPSAKEVAKEEGFLVGDLNLKLLQKIEELTLYTIAQEKKLQKMDALEARLVKLEALLTK